MRGMSLREVERPHDGCGPRLLRRGACGAPSSRRAGGERHIIGWADDWEVSRVTDPVTRPELGPWLRDEKGGHPSRMNIGGLGTSMIPLTRIGARWRLGAPRRRCAPSSAGVATQPSGPVRCGTVFSAFLG